MKGKGRDPIYTQGILFLGPIFFRRGEPKDQMGKLVNRFKAEGLVTFSRSRLYNKLFRLMSMINFMVFSSRRYNLVFIQSFGFLSFVYEDIVSMIAKILDKKIVFTIRGGAFIEFVMKYPKWTKRVLGRAHVITSPSLFICRDLKGLGFIVEYTPNFLDMENFEYKRDNVIPYSILWVRAFHELYNAELAITTLKELLHMHPEATLTMIGPDQGSLSKCKELITGLGLEGKVSVLGYIPNEELCNYYQTHHVFLTTTRYESFGVAIFEAASCGIPNVSMAVGEIPLIWKHNENIILSDRDSKICASKISELFCDDEKAKRISLNAKMNVQNYLWEKVWPKWKGVVEELIN